MNKNVLITVSIIIAAGIPSFSIGSDGGFIAREQQAAYKTSRKSQMSKGKT